MGVPKFAAWLTKKYPAMVGRVCPPDVHGLYVDLNGLIHPCCHDEVDPSVALRPESEKLRQICLAMETLVVTTRPQHVIYIAVDGVAPRAKMNQQRARRYMSVGEPISQRGGGLASLENEFTSEQTEAAEKELHDVASSLHADALYGAEDGASALNAATTPPAAVLPNADALLEDLAQAKPILHTTRRRSVAAEDGDGFDGNCISPGTEFMAKVSVAVRSFLEEKMATGDPSWAHTTLIFSDANTPGEGEHKLLDFLRTQSSFSGFNGHGTHVIAGLDADLIFLSLSLHIPHVFILRDNKRPSSFDKKEKSRDEKSSGEGVPIADTEEPSEGSNDDLDDGSAGISVQAAEHAAAAAAADNKITPCNTYEYYDIDVVGSSLVSEIYLLSQMKGFVMKADVRANSGGELVSGNGYYFDRVGGSPDGVLKTNWSGHGRKQEVASFNPCTATCNSKLIDDFIVMGMIMGNDFLPRVPSAFCGESAMDNIIEVYVSCVLPYGYLTLGSHEIDLKQLGRFFKAYAQIEAVKFRQYCIKQEKMTAKESASPIGSDVDARWREPYYKSTSITAATCEEACRKYVEGLRFVWRYYSCTSAQMSWSWYYPFHHGPFAYDLYKFLEAQGPDVQTVLLPAKLETDPPDTFAQQLCILPPASKTLLPEIFRRYMTAPPEELRDTFPKEWTVDFTASYNRDHLATVMLPFANMDRLKKLVRDFSSHLSASELLRQQNNNFHLVLKRITPPLSAAAEMPEDSSASEDVARNSNAQKKSTYSFEVKGKGLSTLSASLVPSWNLRTDCAELRHYQLREIQPDRCRPRTYSYSVPIFNLTTAADGKVIRIKRNVQRQGQRQREPKSGERRERKPWSSKDNVEVDGGGGEAAMTVGRALAMSTPNFTEFAVCSCGVALLVLFYTTSLCNVAVKVQAVGLFAAVVAVAYLVGFGAGSAGSRKGSGIHRNNIRMTFVDWQCGHCLCLNFSRNNRCFVCEAPFSEHHDWALFSGKNPPDPPLMEPNHEPYLERFGRID